MSFNSNSQFVMTEHLDTLIEGMYQLNQAVFSFDMYECNAQNPSFNLEIISDTLIFTSLDTVCQSQIGFFNDPWIKIKTGN